MEWKRPREGGRVPRRPGAVERDPGRLGVAPSIGSIASGLTRSASRFSAATDSSASFASRARAAGQSARGRRPVRGPCQRGKSRHAGPQASDWHQRRSAGRITTPSPAQMECPRTDTHLTYMIDIVLTPESSQVQSRPLSRPKVLFEQEENLRNEDCARVPAQAAFARSDLHGGE